MSLTEGATLAWGAGALTICAIVVLGILAYNLYLTVTRFGWMAWFGDVLGLLKKLLNYAGFGLFVVFAIGFSLAVAWGIPYLIGKAILDAFDVRL